MVRLPDKQRRQADKQLEKEKERARESERGKSCCCSEWRLITYTKYKLPLRRDYRHSAVLLHFLLSSSLIPLSRLLFNVFCCPSHFLITSFLPVLILLLPSGQLQEGNKDLHAAAGKVLTNRKVSDGTVSLCVCVIYLTSPEPSNTAEPGAE